MASHYPRIPISLAKKEYKKALGAALHCLSTGNNPEKLAPSNEERKVVRVDLNQYEEECLDYLVKQEVFGSKNDVFLFGFQYVSEESQRWPHFLTVRV